jgi:uncharacterized protein YggE
MTVQLRPEIEARLREQAERAKMEPGVYASSLIERGLTVGPPDQATLDLLARWKAEDRTDDPEEIGRREADVQEFMQEMNRTKREMEGANARIPYP